MVSKVKPRPMRTIRYPVRLHEYSRGCTRAIAEYRYLRHPKIEINSGFSEPRLAQYGNVGTLTMSKTTIRPGIFDKYVASNMTMDAEYIAPDPAMMTRTCFRLCVRNARASFALIDLRSDECWEKFGISARRER